MITNDQRPPEIVTDHDLTTRILAEETDPAGLTAEDVMSPELCTLGPEDGFYGAAGAMRDHGVCRLLI